MRKPEEFKRAVEIYGIKFWENHKCGICNVPVGYVFDGPPRVYYKSSCGCGWSQNRLSTWEEVAEHYNKQTHPETISEMDKFWGFDIKLDIKKLKRSKTGYSCPECNASADDILTLKHRGEPDFIEEGDPHYTWIEIHECPCGCIYDLKNGT